ncbi:MAG: tRNA (adenosine(37)-N6)-dimethylallyltransferase MiaA [Amaricoccus sp.]
MAIVIPLCHRWLESRGHCRTDSTSGQCFSRRVHSGNQPPATGGAIEFGRIGYSYNPDYVVFFDSRNQGVGFDLMALAPVIIAGPTASGKSALALRVAERDGGVVLNADALQVYSCWQVLSARPDPEDLARAPHALYGHVACTEIYSVGAWLRDLAPLLADLARQRRRAIIVGGTGLYLSALTSGLAEIPTIAPEVRTRSEAILRHDGPEALIADLARLDPITLARIDRANPMRVQRAWEVVTATGRGMIDWQSARATPLIDPDSAVRVVLQPDISRLNNNITNRFHKMVAGGALEECAAFRDGGFDLSLPSARALGARELMAFLDGALPLDTAVDQAVTATRQFAKRQRTWFRNRMADWTWIDPADADAVVKIPR